MKKYYFPLPDAVAGNEGANGAYNRLNSGFSGCVETMKTGIENEVSSCEFIVDLQSSELTRRPFELVQHFLDSILVPTARNSIESSQWSLSQKTEDKCRSAERHREWRGTHLLS